jgi:peptidoglycan/LPS O-acetylase OafA/YrhL
MPGGDAISDVYAMRNEIKFLTDIRGIAAIVVAGYYFTRPQNLSCSFTPQFILRDYIAVDLFFVLSGFVWALTYEGLFQTSITMRALQRFCQNVWQGYIDHPQTSSAA